MTRKDYPDVRLTADQSYRERSPSKKPQSDKVVSNQSGRSRKAGMENKADRQGLTPSMDAVEERLEDFPEFQEDEWLTTSMTGYPLEGGFDGAERDWRGLSRRVWQVSRFTALFLFCSMLLGWPLGDFLAYLQTYGTSSGWSIFNAYPIGIVMFALVVPIMIIFSGYILSRAMTMTGAAEAIAGAARQYGEPESTALEQVATVGGAVRRQMDTLNMGLDHALMRLADVEAMIRKHVDAIETAGAAIETRATNAVDRVAMERTRLIELTEKLNVHANSFATAIAERNEASVQAMDNADITFTQVEERFGERLGGLETAADRALQSFRQLVEALGGADKTAKDTADAFHEAATKTLEASQKTRTASEQAKQVAQDAINQSVIDAAALANREAVQKAAQVAGEKAGEEALSLAREEAAKIARAAVENAGLELEKIAQGVGEEALPNMSQALESSRQAAHNVELQKAALIETRTELEAENARLEKLVSEQKARAERLANTIALQTEKLAQLVGDAEQIGSSGQQNGEREQGQATKNNTHMAQMNGVQGHKDEAAALRIASEDRVQTDEAKKEDTGTNTATSENVGELRVRLSSNTPPMPLVDKPTSVTPTASSPPLDLGPVQTPREDLQRLNDLARDLAETRSRRRQQSPRASEKRKARKSDMRNSGMERSETRRENSSWKEILAAADEAEPLDLASAQQDLGSHKDNIGDDYPGEEVLLTDITTQSTPQKLNQAEEPDAIQVIARLQQFSMNLDARLYGELPTPLIERFEQGDRNVFAKRLLRLNETDVKRRIRTEIAKDRQFEKDIKLFLKQFDGLLEDAARSDSVDEELREYLSSPLGRIYLLIGEIVGYFA